MLKTNAAILNGSDSRPTVMPLPRGSGRPKPHVVSPLAYRIPRQVLPFFPVAAATFGYRATSNCSTLYSLNPGSRAQIQLAPNGLCERSVTLRK
ncbi:hypothetical protein HN51_049048 [Arachis hypogaea]